jgi:hypothetical protein
MGNKLLTVRLHGSGWDGGDRARQEHGNTFAKSVTRTQQEQGNIMARARQEHGNNMAIIT